MKRFFTLFMAVCVCLATSTVAFAAESEKVDIDYLNYDFPDDAIVIYQGEDGVVYQTNEESTNSARSMQYESVWVDAGKTDTGNFSITNPHPFGGTCEGTFKIESEYSSASGQMILHNGLNSLANKTLSASDGDVRFSFNSVGSNLVITYYTRTISKSHGMRFMCWLW
jgi:hypothetical protein